MPRPRQGRRLSRTGEQGGNIHIQLSGSNKAAAAPAAGLAPQRGAVGRQRAVPGVRDQVHYNYEETSLSTLRQATLQEMFESRHSNSKVRNEQSTASLRDLLQRSAGRGQLGGATGPHDVIFAFDTIFVITR